METYGITYDKVLCEEGGVWQKDEHQKTVELFTDKALFKQRCDFIEESNKITAKDPKFMHVHVYTGEMKEIPFESVVGTI